jgi:transposase InsO family protein
VVVLDEEDTPTCGEVGRAPRMSGRGGGNRRTGPRTTDELRTRSFTPEQRLLILDIWGRSELPGSDFAPLLGMSAAALYKWKRLFEEHGPSGFEERRGAPSGSKLSEITRRTILLLKKTHADWGEDRIHHELQRTKGLSASPSAIARVLTDAGYVVEARPTKPHGAEPKRFERARPGELWQTDFFSFRLPRQNVMVHVVVFLDDHSRFVVAYGLHTTASGSLAREVFTAGIAAYGPPKEVLTDNGAQYVTWRGTSQFTKLCRRRGVKHIVAKPRRPQTLGKTERLWGSLWNECVQGAIFFDVVDARTRLGLYFDYYNFHRTHQGIEGCVPADRFFEAAPEVKATLAARVAKNALELAKHGVPRKPFYLTGRVGDVGISLHGEGEKVVLTREDGVRETVDLGAPGRRAEKGEKTALPEPVAPTVALTGLPGLGEDSDDDPPGASSLDGALEALVAPDDETHEAVDDDDDDDDQADADAGTAAAADHQRDAEQRQPTARGSDEARVCESVLISRGARGRGARGHCRHLESYRRVDTIAVLASGQPGRESQL